MSTLPTDVSPAPPFVPAVVGPVPQATGGQRLRETDCAAGTPAAPVDSRRETVFKIASRREELQAAFGLVYEAYVRSGLCKPNPYRMRVTPYHLLPTTEVFIAVSQAELVCTMSLVADGELGLPMERIYEEEVAWRRMRGAYLGEVSCLADQREGLERSFPVVVKLMGLMAQSARRRGVDELLITVHPRHVKFYQRFIAFRPIGDEKAYGAVCDNPAVALTLDLNRLSIDHPRVYKRFFGVPFPDEVVKYRPMSDQLRYQLGLVVEATRGDETSSEPELSLPVRDQWSPTDLGVANDAVLV